MNGPNGSNINMDVQEKKWERRIILRLKCDSAVERAMREKRCAWMGR